MKLNLREIGDNRTLPLEVRIERLEDFVRDLVSECNVKLTSMEKEISDLKKRISEEGSK